MGLRRSLAAAFAGLGGHRLATIWFGRDRLTVIAYHRVADHRAPDFVGLRANVSAGPEAFADQMRWLAGHFNPVSIADVAAAVGGAALPDRPLLVTFDDGYRDNHDEALPILVEHSIPAVVFLATDFIGCEQGFWWDRVAWLFSAFGPGTRKVPLIGEMTWVDPQRAAVRWISAAKLLPDDDKEGAVAALGGALGVDEDEQTALSGTHLDWDMVRSMRDQGVDFGAHTCRHPILTRVDALRARREIGESVARVESETGRRPLGFAYPNGLKPDFNDEVAKMVAAEGIPLAFSLAPGPSRFREVRADPYQIRRVYIHHSDNVGVMAAKVGGFPRLVR